MTSKHSPAPAKAPPSPVVTRATAIAPEAPHGDSGGSGDTVTLTGPFGTRVTAPKASAAGMRRRGFKG